MSGNKTRKAKTMALLDLEYYNEMEKINNDAELATKARSDDALVKDVVQFTGQVASIVLGVPIIDPIVDTITEVYDYMDKSEHVYLDANDYKFGKDKINNINRDLMDYDSTQTKADILAYGTDQLEWYKSTGGYDYKEDKWTSPKDWVTEKEWEEYGMKKIDKLGDLLPTDKDAEKIVADVLTNTKKDTGLSDLDFNAQVGADALSSQFEGGLYSDTLDRDSFLSDLEGRFTGVDIPVEDFEELPDFQKEWFHTLAVDQYTDKGRFDDLATQFGLSENQVMQVTEDFKDWLKDNDSAFIKGTSDEASFDLLKKFMKTTFDIDPTQKDYNELLHDEFQIRYGN